MTVPCTFDRAFANQATSAKAVLPRSIDRVHVNTLRIVSLTLTVRLKTDWLTLTIRSGAVAAVFYIENPDPQKLAQTLDELMAVQSGKGPGQIVDL